MLTNWRDLTKIGSTRMRHHEQHSTPTYLQVNIVFLVKTLNEGRVENENYEEFGIKVLPPFYKTNLALVCYLFLITISGYVFYRFQNYRYKLKEAVKVEQIERIKAEELHQSKFKFFANISHEFLTPLSIISCSIEELKRMYNIGK